MAPQFSAQNIAAALNAKSRGKDWQACCPAHDDGKASLSISVGDDGTPLVYCHAGCDQADVWKAVTEICGDNSPKFPERKPKKRPTRTVPHPQMISPIPFVFREPPPHREYGPPTVRYIYRDKHGAALGHICRWGNTGKGKKILPQTLWRQYNGTNEWMFKGLNEPRPLYNLEQLTTRPDAPVLVVEGEKAANAAVHIFPDYVVTTWQNGAGAVGKTDWMPLDARTVVIWPDADTAGHKAAQTIYANLKKADVRIVKLPPDLPKGWDLADNLTELGTDPAEILTAAPPPPDPTLARFVMSAVDFLAQDIPEREMIVCPWLPTSGLAMLFAKRGVGKTYMALALAVAVASGDNLFLGHYSITKSRRVLYVDGELPAAELQERVRNYCPTPPDNLMLISSEQMFRKDVRLNIHDEKWQMAINEGLDSLSKRGCKPELIILDSLSTLSSGLDENDNTALDQLINWLIGLRHQGYTVLFLHHAGKSGEQRGASRREDYLDTSIRLDLPDPNADILHEGAHFKLSFSKVRGKYPSPDNLDCLLDMGADGALEWTTNTESRVPARAVILRAIYDNKPVSQKDLCNIVKKTKGSVSQHCKALRVKNELSKDGLTITRNGEITLAQHYPELSDLLQENMPM